MSRFQAHTGVHLLLLGFCATSASPLAMDNCPLATCRAVTRFQTSATAPREPSTGSLSHYILNSVKTSIHRAEGKIGGPYGGLWPIAPCRSHRLTLSSSLYPGGEPLVSSDLPDFYLHRPRYKVSVTCPCQAHAFMLRNPA